MDLSLLGASLFLACGGGVFLLGAVVLREAPGDRLRRVAAAMMFSGGFGPLMGGLGMLLAARGGSALLRTDLATTLAYAWEFFFPSLLLFALVFPREHPLLSRFPRLPWLLYFPYLFHLGFLLSLGRLTPALAGFRLDAPFGIAGSIDQLFHLVGGLAALLARLLARFHVRFFSFVDLFTIAAAVLLLGRSLRARPAPKIRRQLRVILFGLGTCVGLYAIAVPLPALFSATMPQAIRMALLAAALVVGTGSIALAIVRESFLDVGTVFRRAFLFSATFGVLLLALLVVAREADRVLRARFGVDFPLFEVVFVLLAIVFFHPVLNWIDRRADRILAGERVANRRLLRDLAREMTSIFDIGLLAEKTVRPLRDALLGRLNRILCRSTAVGQFATFFFGVYRKGEGELRFCNGGHNPPFILRADGSVDTLTEGGTILGFLEDAPYVERSVPIGEGDLVVFYTDGVTEEARDDDEQFGEMRLVETVRRNRARSARAIVAAVEEEVARFAGRDRFADDFTLIVLRGGAEDAA